MPFSLKSHLLFCAKARISGQRLLQHSSVSQNSFYECVFHVFTDEQLSLCDAHCLDICSRADIVSGNAFIFAAVQSTFPGMENLESLLEGVVFVCRLPTPPSNGARRTPSKILSVFGHIVSLSAVDAKLKNEE